MSEEKITDFIEDTFEAVNVTAGVLVKMKKLNETGCITVVGNALDYVINRFELNEEEVIKMMREVSKEIEKEFGNIVDYVEELVEIK